jgi:integrase
LTILIPQKDQDDQAPDVRPCQLPLAPQASPDGHLKGLVTITKYGSDPVWVDIASQVDTDARVITVDRKVVEVAGHLYIEAPKNRKLRRTIYPRRTPADYPLAEKLATRVQQARAEQHAGINPLGFIFPSPKFKLCRSSNFNRNVLKRAYLAIGWRGADGNGKWTWHSLRHVFCTTALFTWKLDPTDVSCMAGHANVRTTLLMYVGTTVGVLDRARKATD